MASDTTAPFLKNIITVVGRRLQAAGLQCLVIYWGQGESDTAVSTSQSSYAASLATVIAAFNQAMPGCPMIVSRESFYPTGNGAGVRAARIAAVNNTTVFAGADVDTMPDHRAVRRGASQ